MGTQLVAFAENSDGQEPIDICEEWELSEEAKDCCGGIYKDLGTLPPATVVSEDGLASIMGKRCRESIKRAVARGELPQPVKLMGQNCWTVGAIVKHLEGRLQQEAHKVARLRPSA